MAASDSKPIPQKSAAYRVYFPIFKNDGTLITSWAGAAATISKDGGTAAAPHSADTPHEIASTWGIGYLDLDSTDMNADSVLIKVTVTNTGALPQVLALYPQTNGLQIPSNATYVNGVAATSVTTINANLGTTQPENFTGTGASALVKIDMVDVAGAAVNTSTAQIGVNTVNLGGTTQTGRDIGASVLLSSGTGTGQLDFASGVVKANLAQILGTALTETAGQIAAAFKQFFNISSPTSTMNRITLVDTATVATTATNLTNAPTSGDFTATMKTSLNAATPASVVGAVGSVTGSVGSVVGNVGGSVNSVTQPVALTVAYDAAKTAATQTSVNAIPTNTLLTNDARLPAGATPISTFDASVEDVSVDNLTVPALAQFFTVDTGETAGSAVGGSVVDEIVSNSGGTPPTVDQIADAVADELLAGHTTAGSLAKAISDILAKALLITAGGVTYTAPVNPSTDNITIIRGDDYKIADGRQLEWSNAAWSTFSLTTATVTFRLKTRYDETVTVVTASTPSDTQVRVELTSAQTAALVVGRDAYRCDLQAVLANGDTITLVQAKITMLEDIR